MSNIDPKRCADEAIITDELSRRPSRVADYQAENETLSSLAETMAKTPSAILQELVDAAMMLTRSGSAGISLIEQGGEHGTFRWVATAGKWAPYRNGTMPREMSPCGEVIARDRLLLVSEPARAWPALLQAEPEIEEALLAPFDVNGEPKGTIWVIKHRADDRFESEDARLLESLSRFAAAAHQVVAAIADHRESEERQAFLLQLSDALRPLADPATIKARAARLLGEHLQVNRAFYADADASRWLMAKGYEQAIEPLPDAPFAMSDYGDWIIEDFRADRPLVVENMAVDPRFSTVERKANLALSIAAVVALPLVKNGELVAMLTVQDARSRAWSRAELALVGETAERTWAAVEQARAEAALRDSEAKYRTLFETMGQGYVLAETVRDAAGRPIDMRLLEVNPAYERLMGVPAEQARGRGAYEILAGVDRLWLETCDRIARAGQPERIEMQYNEDGGWFEAWIYPRSRDRYEVLFEEITERKRAEEALRENEERQTFLLSLSDALRSTGSAEEAIAVGSRLLGERLGASRVIFGEIVEAEGVARFSRGWSADGAVAHPAELRLRDFGGPLLHDLRSGRAVRFDDVGGPPFARPDLAALVAIGIRAGLSVPLLIGGRFVANLNVQQSRPRHWTDAEVALVGEVAERLWFTIERAQAEAALRNSERFSRALVEGVPQLVWRAADRGKWTWASPQWTDFTGQEEPDSQGMGWLDPVHPDDRERTMEAWDRAQGEGEFHADHRIHSQREDRYRWFQTRGRPVRGDDGSIVEWLGTSTDVDDLRRLQDLQRTLLAELQHRVRNILGVIRSMIRRSSEHQVSLGDFLQHIEGRLGTLARTQVLLTRSVDARVDLEHLIRDELVAQAADETRITLTGPEVTLGSKAAEVFSLAIHELTTNAVKYGALTHPSATLKVEWHVEEREDARWLNFTWSEAGVPIAGTAPRRSGFGTELITQRVPYELKGKGAIEMRPGGIESKLEFPLREQASILQTDARVGGEGGD